jgi:WD40 repeat protein
MLDRPGVLLRIKQLFAQKMSFKLIFQQDKSAVLRFNSTTIGMSEVMRMKAKRIKFTKDFKLVILTVQDKLQISTLEDIDTPIETRVTTDCYETSLTSIYYSANDKLQIYNRSTGKITFTLDLPKITLIAVNQDDSRLAIIANEKIYILTLKTNTTTTLKLPTTKPTSISFYPFKKSVILAGFEDGSVAMWDVNLSSSPNIYKSMVHNAPVKQVSFAPCNKHFYCSVGMDGRLLFHDINARR